MPPTEHDDSAARFWVVLARAHHAISEYMAHSIAALGIGLTDFAVLEVLLHKGPLSMCEIAGKVLLANASMTSAVDRLERRGLVQRSSGRQDRRVRVVDLTPEGRALARRLFAQHERDIDALMVDLSTTEREQVRDRLKKVGLRAQGLLAREVMEKASA